MELAASWNPLTKSNTSASVMIREGTRNSGILQDDPFEDVGDILAAVGRRLEVPVDVLPLDDLDGFVIVVEEGGQRVLFDAVRLVLLGVDRDAPLQDFRPVLHIPEERHGFVNEGGRVAQAAGEEDGVLG